MNLIVDEQNKSKDNATNNQSTSGFRDSLRIVSVKDIFGLKDKIKEQNDKDEKRQSVINSNDKHGSLVRVTRTSKTQQRQSTNNSNTKSTSKNRNSKYVDEEDDDLPPPDDDEDDLPPPDDEDDFPPEDDEYYDDDYPPEDDDNYDNHDRRDSYEDDRYYDDDKYSDEYSDQQDDHHDNNHNGSEDVSSLTTVITMRLKNIMFLISMNKSVLFHSV